jgi:hypothetical protein
VTELHWLHYTLYPGGAAGLDGLLCDVVPAAVSAAAEVTTVARWFFLRYSDELGAHVRLRLAGTSRAAVDEIHRVVDPVLQAAVGTASHIPSPRSPQERGARHGVVGAYLGIYEPETAKYGGPQGLDIAEAVFQTSSETVIELLAPPLPPANRRPLALLLMARAVGAGLPAPQVSAFWDRYQDHWSAPTMGGAPAAHDPRLQAAATRLAEEAAHLEAAERVGRLLATYERAIGRYSETLLRSHIALRPADALFHQIHLTNNRLGIPPMHEGMLARLVSVSTGKDREALPAAP